MTQTDEHPTWSEPDVHYLRRIEWGFVIRTWLLCLFATAVLSAILIAILAGVSDAPLLGTENASLGVSTIASAFATFLGFVVVMIGRLPHVAHDRLTNSLAVAALHVALAVFVLGVDLISRAAGADFDSFFGGSWTDEIGNAFVVLERSAIVAVLACLLAVGMVPARGGRPEGTQEAEPDTDRQL